MKSHKALKHSLPAILVLLACSRIALASPQQAGFKPMEDVTSLANAGDEKSVHALCYRYRYGEGADKNYQKAMQWCSYGAALGIDSAQVLLAEIYFSGLGTARSEVEALHWFSKAADQGHAHALFVLYTIYQNGYGVTADNDRATEYLQRAVDAGYEPAIKAQKAATLSK